MAEEELEYTRIGESDDYDGGDTKGHKHSVHKKEAKEKSVPVAVTTLVKNNLKNIIPIVNNAVDFVEDAYTLSIPYINKAIVAYNQLMKILRPYGLTEIFTCVTGVVMMFFGGTFATTTAVWEAIVQGGLDDFKKATKQLWSEYKNLRKANDVDDTIDEDGDGIADVKQISGEQYALRKMLLALRATNPENISAALHALYTIFVAVMATLRLRFARTISLGASIGDQISQVYKKFVLPVLKGVIEDEEYHKWLMPVGLYVCRMIGVSIAFRIQRILTTVHTAVKGARTLTVGLTGLAERNGYGYLTEGYLDEALSFVLAFTGMYLQLFAWSSVPLVVKLVLFPAFIVEGFLSFFVSAGLSYTTADPETLA